MSDLAIRALEFARAAHAAVDHRRKFTGEPYIVHPIAVAEIVRTVPHTKEMIAAAYLHDTREDTRTTDADIRAAFGDAVADLVAMLTDTAKPEDGNRAARVAINRAHTAEASPAAKTVKLADLIDNTRNIVEHDPNFAAVYIPEKAALLDVLREGDPILHAMARDLVRRYYAKGRV